MDAAVRHQRETRYVADVEEWPTPAAWKVAQEGDSMMFELAVFAEKASNPIFITKDLQ